MLLSADYHSGFVKLIEGTGYDTEKLQRFLENLGLQNKDLRAQVALVEAQSHPEVPERPEDLTRENLYRLSGERLKALVEPNEYAGKTNLQAWKEALMKIRTLPRLARDEYPSEYEFRRAATEQWAAERFAPDSEGKVIIKGLENHLSYVEASPDIRSAVPEKVAKQVNKALEICDPTVRENPTVFSIGAQEILLDTVARSDLKLDSTSPRTDRKVQDLLNLVDNLKLTSGAAELKPIVEDHPRPTMTAISADAARTVRNLRINEPMKRAKLIEQSFNDLTALTTGGTDSYRLGLEGYQGWVAEDYATLLSLLRTQLGERGETIDQRSATEVELKGKATALVADIMSGPVFRHADGAYELLHKLERLAHSDKVWIKDAAGSRHDLDDLTRWVSPTREFTQDDYKDLEVFVKQEIESHGIKPRPLTYPEKMEEFGRQFEEKTKKITAKADELVAAIQARPEVIRAGSAEQLLADLESYAEGNDEGEKSYTGYSSTDYRTLIKLIQEKLEHPA